MGSAWTGSPCPFPVGKDVEATLERVFGAMSFGRKRADVPDSPYRGPHAA